MKNRTLLTLLPLVALACRSAQEADPMATANTQTPKALAEEARLTFEKQSSDHANALGVIEGTGMENATAAELQAIADARYERIKADLAGASGLEQAPTLLEEASHALENPVDALAPDAEGWLERQADELAEKQIQEASLNAQAEAALLAGTEHAERSAHANALDAELEELTQANDSLEDLMEPAESPIEEVLETEEFMRAGAESADWQAPDAPIIVDMEIVQPVVAEVEESAVSEILTTDQAALQEKVESTLEEFEESVGTIAAQAPQPERVQPAELSPASQNGQTTSGLADLTDAQAMEARMLEIATPGAEHKWLDQLKGDWNAKVTYWFMPSADPMPSTGQMTNSWALGGRFLQLNYKGSIMGQSFDGFGHIGYDKVRKAYVGYWVDSMGTQMMNVSTGTLSNDRKSLTLRRNALEPLTGKEREVKEILTIKNDKEHHWQMWGYAPDGTFFRMVEVIYTRK